MGEAYIIFQACLNLRLKGLFVPATWRFATSSDFAVTQIEDTRNQQQDVRRT